MSLNHLTTQAQGFNDKLEIGCYQAVSHGDVKNFQKSLVNINNTNTARWSILQANITTNSVGSGYGYSWLWNSIGSLTITWDASLNGNTTTRRIYGTIQSNGVPSMCFLSLVNTSGNSATCTVYKYNSPLSYSLITAPIALTIHFCG